MSTKQSSWLAMALLLTSVWGAFSGPAQARAEHAAPVQDTASVYMTLEEALAMAVEHSPKVRMARLELEDARLAHEQVHSVALMQPDPVAQLQAESVLELAQRNPVLVQHGVHLEVSESYLGVLRVQNLMEVVQGSLRLAERQLAIAENRFGVGSATKVEVIRAANQVSTTQANLLEMEGSLQLALMAFRMGIGLPLDAAAQPDPEGVEPARIDVHLEEDLRFALEHRLEIVRAQNGVDLARKQIELFSNDYTPAITQARAKVGLQQAEEGLQQAKAGIELEIRQLHQALVDNERRLHVLEQSVEEARETLAITQEMYEVGVATDVEVLGAQTALNQAQTDYVNTLFDLRTAEVRYVHATARTVDREGGNQR